MAEVSIHEGESIDNCAKQCHLHWTEDEHGSVLVNTSSSTGCAHTFGWVHHRTDGLRFHSSKVRKTLMEKENTCNTWSMEIHGRRAYACTCPASPAWSLSLISCIILSTSMEWWRSASAEQEGRRSPPFLYTRNGEREMAVVWSVLEQATINQLESWREIGAGAAGIRRPHRLKSY